MSVNIIDPLKICAKLESLRNFDFPAIADQMETFPRFVEILWFLQWVSNPLNYRGGLRKFAGDLIEKSRDKVGPVPIFKFGNRRYTEEEFDQIMRSVNGDLHSRMIPRSTKRALWSLVDGYGGFEDDIDDPIEKAEIIKQFNFETIQAECCAVAETHLAAWLVEFCEFSNVGILPFPPRSCRFDDGADYRMGQDEKVAVHEQIGAPWYFAKIAECLEDYMRAWAWDVKATLAETAITREIFGWIDRAERVRKSVMFIGNSRFGKTEAIQAASKMAPGRIRIVETPSSSSESDLLREIAKAIGLTFRPGCTAYHELRAAIDLALRNSSFTLVFEEAQFLFPSNCTAKTEPRRLNYVRRSIMDKGVPCVFVCTPQSWIRVEKNFLRYTGYTMEQFHGRLLCDPIQLPNELSKAEMIEVARIHFPTLDEQYLAFVVSGLRAYQGSVLSGIESVARLAEMYAEEAGVGSISLSHLEKAIGDVLPKSVNCRPASDHAPESYATPLHRAGRRIAELQSESEKSRLSAEDLAHVK